MRQQVVSGVNVAKADGPAAVAVRVPGQFAGIGVVQELSVRLATNGSLPVTKYSVGERGGVDAGSDAEAGLGDGDLVGTGHRSR